MVILWITWEACSCKPTRVVYKSTSNANPTRNQYSHPPVWWRFRPSCLPPPSPNLIIDQRLPMKHESKAQSKFLLHISFTLDIFLFVIIALLRWDNIWRVTRKGKSIIGFLLILISFYLSFSSHSVLMLVLLLLLLLLLLLFWGRILYFLVQKVADAQDEKER